MTFHVDIDPAFSRVVVARLWPEHFIGKTVRFAPNPRFPNDLVDARVVRHRPDARMTSARSSEFNRCVGMGWLDTIDEDGFERSVRPSRCEIVDG